jgi:hypothetical protein
MTTSGTGLSIVTSPFNSIVGTNTITTGGTTAGTVPVQPLKARPVGGNSQ